MEINLKEVCAISKYAASTEVTRYYLNGVFAHSDGAGHVYFVATDGHRLIVHRVVNAEAVSWSFIIPRETLAGFKFSKRDTGMADLRQDGGFLVIATAGGKTRVRPVDGTFPDYTRVRPVDDAPTQPAHFNGQYCADFDAFAKILGTQATITPRGENAALVTFHDRDDVYGALMPMRKAFAARAPF